MQVILLEKVVNVGNLGEVVRVRDGYARNFLIPQKKARRATDAALKEFEVRRADLEKAAAENTKIAQLNAELASIEGKKADRERKLAELTAKKTKAKAELEEALKRTDDARTDAISLTDYQKKELSEVETRQANLTKQFNCLLYTSPSPRD